MSGSQLLRCTLASCAAGTVLFSLVTLEAAPAQPGASGRGKSAATKATADPSSSADPRAAARLEEVLRAEVAGRGERRAEMLADLIKQFPDFAPARWHAGQVRTADGWRHFEEASYDMSKHPAQGEYRRLRSATPETGLAQHQLADWCRKAGLDDHDRVHRFFAVSLGVAQHEDYATLGLRNRNGSWLTDAQIKQLDAEATASRRATNQFHGKLLGLRRAIVGDSLQRTTAARDELSRLVTPSMIPLVERLYSSHSEVAALAALDVIERLPGQEAVNSLARHAVFAKWPAVRQQAANRLHDCSVYSYAPLLLAGLSTPIEAQVQAGDTGPGMWQCRLALYREGLSVDTAHVVDQGVRLNPRSVGRSTQELTEAEQAASTTLGQVSQTLEQVKKFNQSVEATNQHITSALSTATGQSRSNSARSWWDWWYDHNDMYRLEDRPVYQTASSQVYTAAPTYPRPRAAECFAPGTQVWTSTGAANIETIEAGDLVLAQDVVTGELAYKPVLATTTRPPTGMVLIRAGHDTITATRGHPFWVSGAGWRMAKELVEGDTLHTVSGTVTIDALEKVADSTAHNLVVDGFSSYFVGTERILVHDNELRLPIDHPVPGLVAKP